MQHTKENNICEEQGHAWVTYTVATEPYFSSTDIEQAGYCNRCGFDTHGQYDTDNNIVLVHLTLVTGEKVTVPYGEHNRCDNCGKTTKEAKEIITGGQLCEVEWACCNECYDEMVEKGCAFEELGDMTYRNQKY